MVSILAFLFGSGTGVTATQNLGAVISWDKSSDGVLFRCEGGLIKVSSLGDRIIRVRAVPGNKFGPDESFAVVDSSPEARTPRIKEKDSGFEIISGSFKVMIDKEPFTMSFYDLAGNLINQDGGGIFFGEAGLVGCDKVMPADEHYYGFGEKTGPLDKRGRKMQMWNSDAMYAGERDPLYQSHPFFIGLRKGAAYGIFFDNTYRSYFDMGNTLPDSYMFSADGGEMNYYFIYGPEVKKVIEEYTSLTGRMPLPPLWSIGYQQCRYSYKNQEKLYWLAKSFREREIPCDVLYMDIHYMDDWKVFTFHPTRFPDPQGMISDLGEKGFRVVTIIDPGIKVEPGYAPYDEGMANGYFAFKPGGEPFQARVWPGDVHWPDFTKPEVREWWGDLHADHIEAGVAGIWNDMNEPAMWGKDKRVWDLMLPYGETYMEQMLFGSPEEPLAHEKIHNVYGLLENQATYEGLLRSRPDKRPFLVTRAGYSGVWRYSAVWTGDNYSTWTHLALALPMHLNMGISGMSFVGSDIGGFTLSPSPEMFARWIQQGVFYPFCRTHTAIHMGRQEPWSFGKKVEKISKEAIGLRYRLLPYTYSLFEESSRTGVPIKRAMLVEFPGDGETYQLQDQFMWGPSLLVAPVIEKGAKTRMVYFPKGIWRRFDDESVEEGPGWSEVSAELDEIPLYAREGSIIPLAPVMNYTGEKPWPPLTLEVYPGPEEAVYDLYEDGGDGFDYLKGGYSLTSYTCSKKGGTLVFEIDARRGGYSVSERDLIIRIHGIDGRPGSVKATGSGKSETDTKWEYIESSGILVVPLRDDGRARVIAVE